MNVGFVGIGKMGLPMARNVLAAGFPLTVWNRRADRCGPLTEAGATVASGLTELGRAADVVVTMVADGAAAREILVDGGLLDALGPGSIVLEMSTIGPLAATALAREAEERDVVLLDAPVSGSVAVAEAAQLFAMVGGDTDGYERARPVLDAMTKGHVHLGRSGAGAAMKLAVNGVIAVTNEAIAEAIVLAERYGIERESAYDVLAGGAVASPFVQYKRESFLRPETAPVGFTAAQTRKDLALALALAADLDVPLPSVAAAQGVIEAAIEAELGAADFSRVADVLRRGRAG
jgi:3-hydroxyisobutyrate dehydrogenase-like beta-hydroxyacid dehydrogenase